MKRLASVTALVAVAAVALADGSARAEEFGGNPPAFGENAAENYHSPQHFMFELKFGPYSPNIDASPGLHGTPFADLFPPQNGKTRPPGKLLTQVEFDYQFLHRFGGTFGVGHSIGYYRRTSHSFQYATDPTTGMQTVPCTTGPTATPTTACQQSGDTTALNIVPLSIMAVYRFDYLALRYRIPFVPYVKIGLAYYIWWIENGNGFLSIAQYTPPGSTSSQGGWGGTLGWVLNPGGAFMLDVLDPTAAKIIDSELGINHTYLFCDFLYAQINGFGASNKLNLSDTTLTAGIGFEF